MAGQIRLFEKIDGLLAEISPDEAEDRRKGRRVSQVNMDALVLWTDQEEAERDAEEAAEVERQAQRQRMEDERTARRRAALEKITALGLTEDDLEALRG